MTISDRVYTDLISTQKLTSSSFTPREFRRWRLRIEFVLSDDHLKYVLSDPSPNSSSKPSKTLNESLSDDERARSIILFAMDDLLFDVYNISETSKQVMDSLIHIFEPIFTNYGLNLLSNYFQCKMAEDTPINEHLLEMRAMAIDLELSGFPCFPIEEEAHKQVILKSLPISWCRVRLGLQHKSSLSPDGLVKTLKYDGKG